MSAVPTVVPGDIVKPCTGYAPFVVTHAARHETGRTRRTSGGGAVDRGYWWSEVEVIE